MKTADILEMAMRRAKLSEIWESGLVVTCIWGTFDLLVFKVILGSFIALVSKWPVTQKRLAIRATRTEFWGSGGTYHMHMAFFLPFSGQGHFGVIDLLVF